MKIGSSSSRPCMVGFPQLTMPGLRKCMRRPMTLRQLSIKGKKLLGDVHMFFKYLNTYVYLYIYICKYVMYCKVCTPSAYTSICSCNAISGKPFISSVEIEQEFRWDVQCTHSARVGGIRMSWPRPNWWASSKAWWIRKYVETSQHAETLPSNLSVKLNYLPLRPSLSLHICIDVYVHWFY